MKLVSTRIEIIAFIGSNHLCARTLAVGLHVLRLNQHSDDCCQQVMMIRLTTYNACQKLSRQARKTVATSNVKLFLKTYMVRLKIISLYIYKDLRLKT